MAGGTAAALGFSGVPTGVVLGAPLDIAVRLVLDPGEALEARCVTADVALGARRLSPGALDISVESRGDAGRVRIRSSVVVDEPVVELAVAVGCASRLERRYVLLADPPALVSATAPPAAAAPAVADAPAAATGPVAAAPRATPAREATARPRAERPPRAAPAAGRPRPPGAAASPRTEARPRLQLDEARITTQAAAPSAAAAAAIDEALAAVAEAASAARATAAAASAAQARVSELEATVVQLRAEAASQRREAEALRARAVADADRAGWVMPLALAVLALAGLAGWLAWRLRALDAERQRAWRAAAAAATAAAPAPPASVTSPIPLVTSVLPGPTAAAAPRAPEPAPRFVTPPPPPPPAPAEEGAAERTALLPPSAPPDDGRDVSIEELLDLEQQAEFFVVLGQDDAAIDLLAEHLRQSGGGSPLPYLKLLEIYRRLGTRDAYDRLRERFNARFNAYAPGWDADLQQGRVLEDYTGVLPRLQRVWPRPLDAMAELEALMFRRSRGDLFELPAYREVLLLYAVARDLHEREAGKGGDVDLLLPLADGGDFSSTAPAPLQVAAGAGAAALGTPDDGAVGRPSLDLDLDLTDRPSPAARFPDTRPPPQN
jgi:hypothetical protein